MQIFKNWRGHFGNKKSWVKVLKNEVESKFLNGKIEDANKNWKNWTKMQINLIVWRFLVCTYVFWTLSTSVRRQTGQVPYVEWLGSETSWWIGWCHQPSPPTHSWWHSWHTPSRAAFFTPKQSHENERTRYLYINRNLLVTWQATLTFPQKKQCLNTIQKKFFKLQPKTKTKKNPFLRLHIFSVRETSFVKHFLSRSLVN